MSSSSDNVNVLLDKLYVLLAVAVTTIAYKYMLISNYFLVINVTTLALYAYDKLASNYLTKYRISEFNLLVFGLMGGWIGAIFGQQSFRHKTRKQPFQNWFKCSIVGHIIFYLTTYDSFEIIPFVNDAQYIWFWIFSKINIFNWIFLDFCVKSFLYFTLDEKGCPSEGHIRIQENLHYLDNW